MHAFVYRLKVGIMLDRNDVLKRNNVKVHGEGKPVLMLAHGFGCDQNMWRFIQPDLETDYTLVLFDYCGSGKSDTSFYSKERYSSLEGFARDIVEIADALALSDVVLMGHSVSSITGLLAANARPDLFSKLVMICPSPCFLNIPPDYHGGFDRSDLEELVALMDQNYVGWARYLAPLVMGSANSPELVAELGDSFCSTDPVFAKNFAKATFFSDNREDLKRLQLPTLILQSARDTLAAQEVGEYMHDQIAHSTFRVIQAEGHCLHMTHPKDVIRELKAFVHVA